MKKLLVFITLLGLLGAGVISLMGGLFLLSRPEDEGREVIFEVTPGSFYSISENLKQQNLITDAKKFRLLARVLGNTNKVRVGEYLLRTDMTPMEVLKEISTGKSLNRPFTVQEGLNIFDVAAAVEAKGFGKRDRFLKACRDKKLLKALLGEELNSCEGYLFPETYGLTKYTDEKTLIQLMIQRFLDNYAKIEGRAKASGMTRHQIVTLASIVEKETGAPEERPIISSVYHNRLKKRMKLQADPTVLYGIWETGKTNRLSITRQDLLTPNRYNTYTNYGLPYGPIANPGFDALVATVDPIESEYLYFVSRNDGTHVFSETYEKHNKAVRQFQLNPAARKGKSWRDLNKRAQNP